MIRQQRPAESFNFPRPDTRGHPRPSQLITEAVVGEEEEEEDCPKRGPIRAINSVEVSLTPAVRLLCWALGGNIWSFYYAVHPNITRAIDFSWPGLSLAR